MDTLAAYSLIANYSAIALYVLAFLAFVGDLSARSAAVTAGAEEARALAREQPAERDVGARTALLERLARPASDRGSGWQRLGFALTVLGWLLHLAALVMRGVAAERVPWANMYEFALTGTALQLKDRADTKNAALRMTLLPEARLAREAGIDAAVIEALEEDRRRAEQTKADTEYLARELAAAPSAAVYGRMGTSTVEFGTVGSWLVDVVNVLTGNLDRPGGAMFPKAAAGQPNTRPGPRKPFRHGRWHSRVQERPEVMSELPVATLPSTAAAANPPRSPT